jgi:hypothetical protein
MTTTAFIHDRQTSRNAVRLTGDGNIYWYDSERNTEEKIGTATQDGKLLDLGGKFTGLYLCPATIALLGAKKANGTG